MSPNASGDGDTDHARSVELCRLAFEFSIEVLNPKSGTFLCKLLQGKEGMFTIFLNHMRSNFFISY